MFVVLALAWVSACSNGEDLQSTYMQEDFSWVIDGELAGMSLPGLAEGTLDDDITFLANQGVTLVVSLTTEPVSYADLADSGIGLVHIPIVDLHAPYLEQQLQFVAAVASELDGGGAAAVHCTSGLGRTGTMLATYFVYLGMTPQEAIDEIRALRPGSIENAEQEEAVHDYNTWMEEHY